MTTQPQYQNQRPASPRQGMTGPPQYQYQPPAPPRRTTPPPVRRPIQISSQERPKSPARRQQSPDYVQQASQPRRTMPSRIPTPVNLKVPFTRYPRRTLQPDQPSQDISGMRIGGGAVNPGPPYGPELIQVVPSRRAPPAQRPAAPVVTGTRGTSPPRPAPAAGRRARSSSESPSRIPQPSGSSGSRGGTTGRGGSSARKRARPEKRG